MTIGTISDAESGSSVRTKLNKVIATANFVYNVKNEGLVGNGSTNDGTALQTLIDTVEAAGGGTIMFPTSSDTYLVSSTVQADAGVHFLMAGGIIEVTGSLTINGDVTALNFHAPAFDVATSAGAATSKLKIRNASDTGLLSETQGPISPAWFVGNDDDWGIKIGKVFQTGGATTICQLPSGEFFYSTSIILDKDYYGSHLKLRGEGFLHTSLRIDDGLSIVGINGYDADETVVEEMLLSAHPGQNACNIMMGGGDLVLRNLWIGGGLYGILQVSGGGWINNVLVEGSLHCLAIRPMFTPYSLGITGATPGTNLLYSIYDNVRLEGGGSFFTPDDEFQSGLVIRASYVHVTTGGSGNFTIGETVTGGTSGKTARVDEWDAATRTRLLTNETTPTGNFTNSETVTGGTSGATTTISSAIGSQTVAGLLFNNLVVRGHSRHGATISDLYSSTITGARFEQSGSRPGSVTDEFSAGLVIGKSVVQLQIIGAQFIDNGSVVGGGCGLHMNGAGSTVTLVAPSFFSTPTYELQDYGIRMTAGALNVIAPQFDESQGLIPFQEDGAVASVVGEMSGTTTGILTLANSATPSVSAGSTFLTGGTTTITDLTGGFTGKRITIIGAHTVTLTHGTNMFMKAAANFAMTSTNSIEFVRTSDGNWREV